MDSCGITNLVVRSMTSWFVKVSVMKFSWDAGGGVVLLSHIGVEEFASTKGIVSVWVRC